MRGKDTHSRSRGVIVTWKIFKLLTLQSSLCRKKWVMKGGKDKTYINISIIWPKSIFIFIMSNFLCFSSLVEMGFHTSLLKSLISRVSVYSCWCVKLCKLSNVSWPEMLICVWMNTEVSVKMNEWFYYYNFHYFCMPLWFFLSPACLQSYSVLFRIYSAFGYYISQDVKSL